MADNANLCAIFEMLISRLDSLKDNQAAAQQALKAQLDQQNLAVRYQDSLRSWGEPFSAVPWTGHCLEMTVCAHFEASGKLLGSLEPGEIYVISLPESPSLEDIGHSTLCEMFPGVLAAGRYSIAMTECKSIQTAITTAVDVAHHFNLDPPSHITFHTIRSQLVPLALSIIRGFGEREAFEALTLELRTTLKQRGHEYFNACLFDGVPSLRRVL